jgi:hypothetical protein
MNDAPEVSNTMAAFLLLHTARTVVPSLPMYVGEVVFLLLVALFMDFACIYSPTE